MKQGYTSKVMTGMFLVVVSMILVFANLIVAQLPPVRIDLTANAQYSLSEATKGVLARLEDRVRIEVYFTKDLPAPYNQHAAYVRDLLEEYQAYGKGSLAFEFIDPGTDDSQRQEMMMKGVYPVQIQQVKDDQIGIKQAFMGIVLNYGTKKESIPVVRSTDGLEYEMTGLIRKLTAQQLKTVAFALGHGEPRIDEKMQRIREELAKNYKITSHDFSTAKEIPENVTTLAIVSPAEKWSDEHLFYLDQFIMRGGTVAFLLDNVGVDLKQLVGAKEIDHGLYEILSSYGITPEKNLVLDPQCNRINVETMQGSFRIRNVVAYPYFPAIRDLNREHILTKEIGGLGLPFVSSLTVAQNKPNVTYNVLARTSNASWLEKGHYMVSPMERKVRPSNPTSGPFNVVVVANGKLTSFFGEPKKQEGAEYIKEPEKVLKESAETRILVVGDGSLAQDEFADQEGLIFTANAIDWLAQDSELIKIRNRGLADRPIVELGTGARQAIRYGNMLGIPVAFILFGIIRWQWRKNRLRGFRL